MGPTAISLKVIRAFLHLRLAFKRVMSGCHFHFSC